MSQLTNHTPTENAEQAAERLFPDSNIQKRIFIKGAQFQMGKSYNEEEVLELIQTFNDVCGRPNKPHQIKIWFEQFKKK